MSAMVPKNELVVITGGTGHVGYAVLVEVLRRGFDAVAVIRDPSQRNIIQSSGQIGTVLGSCAARLSFATVSDITATGAFDSVLEESTYIIHVATPLARPSMKDYQAQLIQPAVKGTINLLNSAMKFPTIKRVIITSSTSALVDEHSSSETRGPVSPSHRQPDYGPEYYSQDSTHAYTASKTAALNASDDFLNVNKPHFDIVNIMPSYVFGPKGLAASVKEFLSSSNVFGIGVAMRRGSWRDLDIEAVSCHVADVAKSHVNALDLERIALRPGTHYDFILAVPFVPEDVHSIVRSTLDRKWWEDNDCTAPFGATGYYNWHHRTYDVSATENVLLGTKLGGFESQIQDSANQILHFLGNGDVYV